ncbi:hypothetical protein [Methylocystis echinoides]|uniref:Uncharacterized protein n=1 Tax=Methylocystis echinoides TaxID=29468 RepID=A0A9W6LUL5_9HYPH|nr:hypothetical protein [Methylocystis echinoides]GLI95768.1 hypothetical protein LMG27198_47600 [Methylocystis echinoides]
MRWAPRSFPREIRRELKIGDLADASMEELEQAEEDGSLAGNRSYRDLRGFSWEGVRAALDAEISVIKRLKAAEDLEAEISAFEDLQATSFEDEPALWGLDVGVAAATIALSAYGATPVSSCNAGAFGGEHQARYPYAAFFLPKELAPEIVLCAAASDVGLVCDENGVAQIYGRGEMDLVRFAETAWKRNSGHGPRSFSESR